MGSSPRYGVRIRKQEEAILKQQKQVYSCPSCSKARVKRKGNSIWQCKACDCEFAGGAYSPATDVGVAARKVLASKKVE